MDKQDIYNIYKNKRYALIISASISMSIILFLLVLKIVYKFDFFVFVIFLLIVASLYKAAHYYFWNCPNCGESLGPNISRKVCYKCGTIFNEDNRSDLNVKDLYSAYKTIDKNKYSENFVQIEKILTNDLNIQKETNLNISFQIDDAIEKGNAPPKLTDEEQSIVRIIKSLQIILVFSFLLFLLLNIYYQIEYRIRFLSLGIIGILPLLEYIQSNYTREVRSMWLFKEQENEYAFALTRGSNLFLFMLAEIVCLFYII